MPSFQTKDKRGVSKSNGHMYYTNATSGCMLESEKKVIDCRNAFNENKFSYKYSHDPILHIKQDDAKHIVPFVEPDGEREDEVAKSRERKAKLIEDDINRLEYLKVKKIAAMAKLRRCSTAISHNDYVRERTLDSTHLSSSAKKMLEDDGTCPSTQFDEFNYPPRPRIFPRYTCIIASLGFKNAVTAEAMAGIFKTRKL